MSAKNTIEKKTSWEIVITYLIVIIMCGAMIFYIFDLQHSSDNQRVNINTQNKTLELMNGYTQAVHQAQSAANLFAFSDNPEYLEQFETYKDQIMLYSDSITRNDTSSKDRLLLQQIQELIVRKGQLSNAISRQFYYFNPLAKIDSLLTIADQAENKVTVSSITHNDTIIHHPRKKKFWQRLNEVFKPSTYEDSIVQIKTTTTDTLKYVETDTLPIISDLKDMSHKAQDDFQTIIKQYEVKASNLIESDNQLSQQISALLLALNKEILDSSVKEIEKSKSIIDKNIQISTSIGIAVMILIVIFSILIINDVNKGYRARKFAEEAKKKTEEIMESRHKLLLSVSHDIKTPLSSILGNVELIDTRGDKDDKELSSIRQSADHILTLLTNLLDYSSLEQGQLQVSKSFFNIDALCKEISEMFEPIAKNKSLEFQYRNRLSTTLCANSDRLKIKQIISNLISNAIKYTIEGTVLFNVDLKDGNLVFDIEDTGVGIPKDKVDDIFKPFVRIESYNTLSEGNGYGLSVVKGLVELLEGQIIVTSDIGKGTHFEVQIPMETEDRDLKTPLDSFEKHNALKILIIDDDDTLLSVISDMLQQLGHQPFNCKSKSSLDNAMSHSKDYDYVLTDREMGAITGIDILKKFKTQRPDLPVILMTARVEYNIEKAREEGFDGFLEKPFSMRTLAKLFGMEYPTDGIPKHEDIKEDVEEDNALDSDFNTLYEMLGRDSESVRNVLNTFAKSTADDVIAINEAIEADDFNKAGSICHKMLPMFIQLGQNDAAVFLSKMNDMHGQKKSAEDYPEWKNDALAFMQQTDDLLDMLEEKYGINS